MDKNWIKLCPPCMTRTPLGVPQTYRQHVMQTDGQVNSQKYGVEGQRCKQTGTDYYLILLQIIQLLLQD